MRSCQVCGRLLDSDQQGRFCSPAHAKKAQELQREIERLSEIALIPPPVRERHDPRV